ncbi:MAG: hypothetical protein FJ303_09020 [Planctomycetes bacterium]|nr:hypothetical protein [Planctomycetota bacterium]
MSFLSIRYVSWAVLVGATLLGSTSARAQDAAVAEPVNITTVDGVKLKGLFYPSAGRDAPTVIILHPINDKNGMKSPEWKNLAEALQKAKYSVMMFDFRGHGDSTSIDEANLFWSKPQNQISVKTKNKQVIEVKDYIKQGNAYLPVLVNDIAAVRAYLERRNDTSKDCNTSNLIVIGAESGATLGALWINSEWYRYKFTPHPMFPQVLNRGTMAAKSEGVDIIAAVFLSVSPTLEKRSVKVEGLLKTACKDNGMAATFFCGSGDKSSANFAKNLESKLKVKNSNKHEFIGAVELNTDLTGMKLLQKGLKTEESIVKYLDAVVADRKVQREDREFANTFYVWRTSIGIFRARNNKTEKNLNFDDYSKFITP